MRASAAGCVAIGHTGATHVGGDDRSAPAVVAPGAAAPAHGPPRRRNRGEMRAFAAGCVAIGHTGATHVGGDDLSARAVFAPGPPPRPTALRGDATAGGCAHLRPGVSRSGTRVRRTSGE